MNTNKLLKNFIVFFVLIVGVISCTEDDEEDEEDGPCETKTTCFNGTCIESPVPGTCFD